MARYDQGTKEKIDFYMDEIERQGNFKFLKFFSLPNTWVFIPLTLISSLILEYTFSLYFIPLIGGAYLIFDILDLGSYQVELAEKCVADEMYMEWDLLHNEACRQEMLDLGFPLSVTNEERSNIAEKMVAENPRPNILKRINSNPLTIFIVIGVYMLLHLFVKHIG